jgi:multiple sugar transport system substrate-binding protein
MKRVGLSFLMLVVILLSSGFNLAQRVHGQPVLTFYFWGGSGEYKENVAAVSDVERKLGVYVKKVQEQGDYEQGLLTRIAAHNGPDFFYAPDWWVPELASKGVLLNLDPYIKKYPDVFKASDYVPQSVQGLTYNGHLYGLPRGYNATVVYYNKDIFDQMHVPYPSANWTMADMLDIAKKLTTKDHWGLMLHNGPGASDKPNFFWFLWQFGADFYNASHTACALTDPKAQQAFQWVLDLTYKYHVQPTATDISANGGWSGAVFDKGKAAMIIGTQRWFYLYAPLLGSDGPKFRWGVQLPPLAMDGKHRYSWPGYAGMAIWSGTRNPDLAFKVGSAISSSHGQQVIAGVGSDMPTYLPALHSSAIYIAPDRQADVISVQALQYTRLPTYVTQEKEVEAAISHDLANLWQNKDTVATATQTLCNDVNPLLK